MDYSKGGGQGAASCRPLTGLLQSPHFLCSYVLILCETNCSMYDSQVEELRPEKRKQVEEQKVEEISPDVTEDKAEGNTCQYNTSLLSELQEDVLSTSVLVYLLSLNYAAITPLTYIQVIII